MHPRRSVGFFLVTLAFVGACAACSQPQPQPVDTRAADEAAIRAGVVEWDKAGAAKDLEKTVSFYGEGAAMFPPNAPIAATKDEIHQAWAKFMALPGFALSLATTKVEVAKSGDLAYETGAFELTVNDAKGKPVKTPGKYVVVWKKQADGSWKAVADIFNANQ